MGYVNLRSQNMIPDEEPLREEARDLTSQLESEELVVSESHRSPLRFNIPAKVVGYYFPKLYPEGSI